MPLNFTKYLIWYIPSIIHVLIDYTIITSLNSKWLDGIQTRRCLIPKTVPTPICYPRMKGHRNFKTYLQICRHFSPNECSAWIWANLETGWPTEDGRRNCWLQNLGSGRRLFSVCPILWNPHLWSPELLSKMHKATMFWGSSGYSFWSDFLHSSRRFKFGWGLEVKLIWNP